MSFWTERTETRISGIPQHKNANFLDLSASKLPLFVYVFAVYLLILAFSMTIELSFVTVLCMNEIELNWVRS